MSKETNPNLENQMIYSVFVRNHSPEGTFDQVIDDLDRIRDLGTDILWLMPVCPIGKECRKGKDGSPYAIADYREINPAFGTWDDLKRLTEEAHKRDMKVIVDVVFNHTSPDSRLRQEHPEWFYHDENGNPVSIVEEWSDIIDLDYSNPELQDELVDTLRQFAGVVDGFRCDVASRIPVSFWKKARAACEEVHPGMIWLAESCHLPFIKFVRDCGRPGENDSSLYEAFDILYDYDTFPELQAIFEDNGPIQDWVDALIDQEASLPVNAIKLRNLENHDHDRIAKYIKDPLLWKNWMAMLFTLRGTPLIYHGQELRESHRPSIFDQDPIDWSRLSEKESQEASAWISNLSRIHHELFTPLAVINYEADDKQHILDITRDGYTAFFLLDQPESDRITISYPNGTYENLFDHKQIHIVDHQAAKEDFPLLLKLAV